MLFFKKIYFFSKKYFQAAKELFQIPSLGLNLKRPPIKAKQPHTVKKLFFKFYSQQKPAAFGKKAQNHKLRFSIIY